MQAIHQHVIPYSFCREAAHGPGWYQAEDRWPDVPAERPWYLYDATGFVGQVRHSRGRWIADVQGQAGVTEHSTREDAMLAVEAEAAA